MNARRDGRFAGLRITVTWIAGCLVASALISSDSIAAPPAAGLGSCAAFAPIATGAMVMGDTVVFEDEVDTAMDAAFAHGLTATALHNHFVHDTLKVYFMHIGGEGQAETLAAGVKAVWGAIRAVRSTHPQPAMSTRML
jgi:hypothetical protein